MRRGRTPLSEVDRTWSSPGDPLLQEDADCHGFMWLSTHEEAMILAARAQNTAQTDTAA